MICEICNLEFSERSHFWKIHKIKEKDYYEKHIPKTDLLTGEKIGFSNPEKYELDNFKDKKNLKKYLELNKEIGLEYLTNWLKTRKQLKNLEFGPSHFELRALQYPGIKYIEEFYGQGVYKNICEKSGLKIRYNYNQEIKFEDKNLEFVMDSREQKGLSLKDYQISTLPYGDYTIKNSNIYIERKSIMDLIGSVTSGFDRLCREIEKCKNDNNYLIVLIEEKFQNLLSFPYLPHCKKTKVSVEYLHHNIREIYNKYPLNIQFLSVNGRLESVKILEQIFKITNNIREIDLQYEYDRNQLN
ncbi:MAG: ERCC4 domain-containing protein [bacterium]|nr:ERCC4 domain-containing protein [bacterium]